jgi:hypothetical protein
MTRTPSALLVLRWVCVVYPSSLSRAGMAEPLRVTPPEAVAYLLELVL